MFGTTTLRFQEVKASRQKSGKCPKCGKPVVRRITFSHTINPFNKNKKGLVKTFDEVNKDVRAEADKWKPDFHHDRCL